MLVETVWAVCVLSSPWTVVVWSTVQPGPDVVQSPSTTFDWLTLPPSPALWVESWSTVNWCSLLPLLGRPLPDGPNWVCDQV